ncbi:MAG: diacylglycerol kinase [Zetaproteobacteria bacterium CG_4_9_14_3_um_filter_49_83]|nr:MAG: diacylglycerol kinase [Zetaproteobacteria bacterium CG1_02_49_23]PIQ30622.1 MAG: diacylglycerol kinase [Zetaproteobacteria bacterium CG17_big_fil_post_rev_8_21_14_2_50_50_13]PIV31474.1 MAG: diacylglycerol kinase [Zetaproteobacteria bacterium CG02_land_8_20_14_3_00_50_9]PIY56919.1 MAG: diacylglycerol kinase [Zetaproteobacteria bacterium CG_4_10_14_0_8_um_filter_49_80]PJA35825.1 MAG: diacylglycerol kinase [Zetaproteobacteria bacterium CG_4_9_14_3_um_filter_49_83]
MNPHPQKSTGGLQRIFNATSYSIDGLRAACVHEAAFRQELVVCVILLPLAFCFDVSGVERALMIFSLLLVLIIELVNSAIEAIVDRVSQEKHPLSKRAKDIGSAAVLISLINIAVIWACILIPKF